MRARVLIGALISVAFLAGPVLAGDRLDKTHENARVCKGKIAAKHVPAANMKAEMDKCASDPQGYQ